MFYGLGWVTTGEVAGPRHLAAKTPGRSRRTSAYHLPRAGSSGGTATVWHPRPLDRSPDETGAGNIQNPKLAPLLRSRFLTSAEGKILVITAWTSTTCIIHPVFFLISPYFFYTTSVQAFYLVPFSFYFNSPVVAG